MTSISETIARTAGADVATDPVGHDPGTHIVVSEASHSDRDLHHQYWQLEVALVRVRQQSTTLSRAIAGLSP